jgi:hypothetical protein
MHNPESKKFVLSELPLSVKETPKMMELAEKGNLMTVLNAMLSHNVKQVNATDNVWKELNTGHLINLDLMLPSEPIYNDGRSRSSKTVPCDVSSLVLFFTHFNYALENSRSAYKAIPPEMFGTGIVTWRDMEQDVIRIEDFYWVPKKIDHRGARPPIGDKDIVPATIFTLILATVYGFETNLSMIRGS